MFGGEIKRQRGEMEGYINIDGRGKRGKNISCTKCIEFMVDNDF